MPAPAARPMFTPTLAPSDRKAPSSATEALNRIQMPKEAAERAQKRAERYYKV